MAFILVIFLTQWVGNGKFLRPDIVEAKIPQEPIVFERANAQIQAVMAVQNRHTADLLEEPGIVGTATGVTEKGRPAILVFAKSFELAKSAKIPIDIENVPVIVKITGEIKALKGPPSNKGKKANVDPTLRFDRPVPIGVSTGHPAITAGTIGCRVTDGTNVYALSNNHVYANENSATIEVDHALQPGPYDGGIDPDDTIGTLFDFIPIKFDGSDNFIDAAIAVSSVDLLGNATPSDGYGTPKIQTVIAAINQPVMKYGRTTKQTKGKVYAINATVNVGYDSGTALFVDQIIITPGSFSAGGDSGSLIVVQKGKDARKPVGLLFAGSQTFTVANPIDNVLGAFGVDIDGE